MFDKSQLMKGTLEGCILKIISRKSTYGYEILENLKKEGFVELIEGTIYPILLRLEKKGFIKGELKESPYGPKRKYFNLTKEGYESLGEFEKYFNELNEIVNRILK